MGAMRLDPDSGGSAQKEQVVVQRDAAAAAAPGVNSEDAPRAFRSLSDLQREFQRRAPTLPKTEICKENEDPKANRREVVDMDKPSQRPRPAPLGMTDAAAQEERRAAGEPPAAVAFRRLEDLNEDFQRRLRQSAAAVAPTKGASDAEAQQGVDDKAPASAMPKTKKSVASAAPTLRPLEDLTREYREKRGERQRARKAVAATAPSAVTEATAGAAPPVAPSTGTIRKLIEGKGFGFVAPDGGAADVFLHCSDLIVSQELVIGMRVRFEAEVDAATGKTRARHASILEVPGPAPGPPPAATKRSARSYGREDMLCVRQALLRVGKLKLDAQYDDERIVAQLEARLSRESGFDAKNAETFGVASVASGWTYEAAVEANERLKSGGGPHDHSLEDQPAGKKFEPAKVTSASVAGSSDEDNARCPRRARVENVPSPCAVARPPADRAAGDDAIGAPSTAAPSGAATPSGSAASGARSCSPPASEHGLTPRPGASSSSSAVVAGACS